MATSSYLFHARFINAKINEWNYEKQDIYTISKYLSTRPLLNINRMVILQWSNMANILTKYLLIRYTEKDTVPFLSCPKCILWLLIISKALNKTKLKDILQKDGPVLSKTVKILR